MGRVVVLGSINVDLVTRVRAHPRPGETVPGTALQARPGGKGANQALAAARAGAPTRFVGRIGDDRLGSVYLEGLAERGVDVTGVRSCPGASTGRAVVVVAEGGENTIVVSAGANGLVDASDVDRLDLDRGDVLLLQLEVPTDVVSAAVDRAVAIGARVVLNPSPWRHLPSPQLSCADPVVVNEVEAAQLGSGLHHVCVTRGAAGARWGEVDLPAPSVSAVDTTGAGDAFAGALAAALSRGADRSEALAAAVAAGAEAVTWTGAQGWDLPTL